MNEHFNRNDETLVELTLLGDGTAYEELVTRHQRAVMGTAYKVTKNKFSAEDASQDAFVFATVQNSALGSVRLRKTAQERLKGIIARQFRTSALTRLTALSLRKRMSFLPKTSLKTSAGR